MTNLKIAMIACGSLLTFAAAAQANDLRIGNGTTTVTISRSADGRAASTANQGDSQSFVSGRRFGAANGSR
jgi:hypothetical protein